MSREGMAVIFFDGRRRIASLGSAVFWREGKEKKKKKSQYTMGLFFQNFD